MPTVFSSRRAVMVSLTAVPSGPPPPNDIFKEKNHLLFKILLTENFLCVCRLV